MRVQRFEYTTRGAVHCDGPCGCIINGPTVEIRAACTPATTAHT